VNTLPQGFGIKELVPPETFALGEDKALALMDQRLLDVLGQLKAAFGYTMIIDSWGFASRKYDEATGSPYKYSGYRPVGCNVGVIGGAHYKGMAADIKFYDATGKRIPTQTMQKLIIQNMAKFPKLVAMELNVSWNHIDVMTEKDSSSRGGVVPGKIFMFNVTDNSKSWTATKPEDSARV
jgi:hypothetical protein